MRLSQTDLDVLQRTILAVHEPRDTNAFRAAVPGICRELVDADHTRLIEADFDSVSGRLESRGHWESRPMLDDALMARSGRLLGTHPFCRHLSGTGDLPTLRLSDFMSLRQLRDTALYREFYVPTQTERVLGTAWRAGNCVITATAMRGAGSRDFGERDRLMLDLLVPHLRQAHCRAARTAACRESELRELEACGLTSREAEVACWMAKGKTNSEIATILRTSVRTAEKHVERVLGKLGVDNRTAAAMRIVCRGSERD